MSQTLPIAVTSLALLFLLETLFPLRQRTRPLFHRLLVNGVLSAFTYLVAAALVRPVSLEVMRWGSAHSFGLFRFVPVPAWLEAVLGFLLLDASFYYWHRLNHRIPFLWRFHNVHHFDPDLDASTGFRFHFGEVTLSVFFRAAQVAVLGVSLSVFLVYELVFQLETYFHHSNWRLRPGIERLLALVIVTPRMHGIHHSQFHEETDSNYSVVFSFWDRLHRTFHSDIPQAEIQIGTPAYSNDSENRVVRALVTPFRAQRNYWLGKEKRNASRSEKHR